MAPTDRRIRIASSKEGVTPHAVAEDDDLRGIRVLVRIDEEPPLVEVPDDAFSNLGG